MTKHPAHDILALERLDFSNRVQIMRITLLLNDRIHQCVTRASEYGDTADWRNACFSNASALKSAMIHLKLATLDRYWEKHGDESLSFFMGEEVVAELLASIKSELAGLTS